MSGVEQGGQMGKQSRNRDRKPKSGGIPGFVKLIAALAVVALLLYGVTEMSGVPYDEDAIGVVDFSGLTSSQKREALQAANRSRCTCGCGMNTAQCVATDSTCPVREDNIKKIRTMVREAGQKS
jgi:hypothetical protein